MQLTLNLYRKNLMTKGAKKDSHHFEDTQMNPTTKKDHPKEMSKEQTQKKLDGISRNVQGKSGT